MLITAFDENEKKNANISCDAVLLYVLVLPARSGISSVAFPAIWPRKKLSFVHTVRLLYEKQ